MNPDNNNPRGYFAQYFISLAHQLAAVNPVNDHEHGFESRAQYSQQLPPPLLPLPPLQPPVQLQPQPQPQQPTWPWDGSTGCTTGDHEDRREEPSDLGEARDSQGRSQKDGTTDRQGGGEQGQEKGTQKPKRKHVKNACGNCQKACKRCDDGRPCQRCIKLDLVGTCVDSTRKKRKTGFKRGPYKRKQQQQQQQQRQRLLLPSQLQQP